MKIENIKFKAKSLNSGEWVVGDLAHRITDTCIAVKDMDDIVYYPVDPATVCQFTGLKDCEGKEVWEGDVIDINGFKAEIIWNQDALAFMILYEYETEPSTYLAFITSTYLAFINRHGKILVLYSKFDKDK